MEAVVKDAFEVNGRVAQDYGASGLVIVFELSRPPELHRGDVVTLMRADGSVRSVRAGETKEHGGLGRSVFLEGILKEEVPVGTRITWGTDVQQVFSSNQPVV